MNSRSTCVDSKIVPQGPFPAQSQFYVVHTSCIPSSQSAALLWSFNVTFGLPCVHCRLADRFSFQALEQSAGSWISKTQHFSQYPAVLSLKTPTGTNKIKRYQKCVEMSMHPISLESLFSLGAETRFDTAFCKSSFNRSLAERSDKVRISWRWPRRRCRRNKHNIDVLIDNIYICICMYIYTYNGD